MEELTPEQFEKLLKNYFIWASTKPRNKAAWFWSLSNWANREGDIAYKKG